MYVYDPLYGQIEIDSEYVPIVNSVYFRRLQHLRQLGLCYLSFPGGNHTRFEHSLGAFHLASLLEEIVDESSAVSKEEGRRLVALLRLGALCHDLGHGPFSHMTENVLSGLGSRISHEEVGAAIVAHHLERELEPFSSIGISPLLIGQLITKSAEDPFLECATELVSSDLDLDRLDYLHRDSHYSGQYMSWFSPRMNLAGVWELRRHGDALRFELTDEGIHYAEKMLFLRRNNYQNVVFESRHMCVTGMFEKAVQAIADTDLEFGHRVRAVAGQLMNWADKDSVREAFPEIWKLYGLVDYQAFDLLSRSKLPTLRQLVHRIRLGDCYPSVKRVSWHELHYLSKQLILNLKTEAQAFSLRRTIEKELARSCRGVQPISILCHLPRFSVPRPLSLGTIRGDLLEYESALGRFLIEDVKHHYRVELFLDQSISNRQPEVVERFRDMMVDGNVTSLRWEQ